MLCFQVLARDPQRAMAFYSGLLGWSFLPSQPEGRAWRIQFADPRFNVIHGVLVHSSQILVGVPTFRGFSSLSAFAFSVPSLVDALSDVERLGGTVLTSTGTVECLGERAGVRDTEGNVFALLQEAVLH
jgi:predicted enzyme related to lactoylglutathione lyase